MNHQPILFPVLALLAWTMIIMVWMMIARVSAFRRAGIRGGDVAPGTRGDDLDGRIDPVAQWKAHNYTHLLEQPTAFYALCLLIVVGGLGTHWSSALAWGYVAVRVAHSLLQASVNIVRYRAMLFVLSSSCLLALTILTVAKAL
jgi:hypothetical protein